MISVAWWAGGWRYRLHAGAAFGWGEWSRPYARQGQAWREAHSRCPGSPEHRNAAIVRARAAGEKLASIAALHGVNLSTVRYVLRRERPDLLGHLSQRPAR